MADFERFVEVVSKKEDKRVVNVTVRPFAADCEGNVWFTDLMLQEGDMLSGYTVSTDVCLKESENNPVWFNGVVRSEETIILLNLGGTSAGLDIHLYPKQRMDGGSVTLAQGVGGQKATFPVCLQCRGRCGSACILAAMHEERRQRKEVRLLPVQRGVGFQAHRVPAAGKVRTAFIFDAGNRRWR